jgi:uncharacterized protein YcnI
MSTPSVPPRSARRDGSRSAGTAHRGSSRPRTLALTGLLAGAVLAVAAPLAASAHVHVSPEESAAGTSTRLTFAFSHGCDGSPTTALVVQIPEGVDGVTPVVDGPWTVGRELGSDGIATSVTYTATTPIDDGLAAAVEMDVIFASSAEGTRVAFPVRQQCVQGETDWSQVAEEGQDPHDLDSPAPVVAVGTGGAGDGAHDHGGAGHGDDTAGPDADADDDAPTADEPVTASSESDGDATAVVSLWLSGGALLAAVAALVVSLRRRRS